MYTKEFLSKVCMLSLACAIPLASAASASDREGSAPDVSELTLRKAGGGSGENALTVRKAGVDQGKDATLLMPALMKAKEKANQTMAPTDQGGGTGATTASDSHDRESSTPSVSELTLRKAGGGGSNSSSASADRESSTPSVSELTLRKAGGGGSNSSSASADRESSTPSVSELTLRKAGGNNQADGTVRGAGMGKAQLGEFSTAGKPAVTGAQDDIPLAGSETGVSVKAAATGGGIQPAGGGNATGGDLNIRKSTDVSSPKWFQAAGNQSTGPKGTNPAGGQTTAIPMPSQGPGSGKGNMSAATTSSGGHTGNMVGNHKDVMMGVSNRGSGSPTGGTGVPQTINQQGR